MTSSASTDTFPDLNEAQPAPKPSAHPAVWDLVVRDMHARDLGGERKYGMRLRPFDGRATMVDAYQEVLDLAVYLRKHLYEAEHAQPLPADVAEVRCAAGITIAPEAALHRALQERTDELERVRRDLTAEKAFAVAAQRRLVEARAERDGMRRERDEARESARADGPVFVSGRHEGWSDIAVKLRAILDPADAERLNLDGLLHRVAHLAAERAAWDAWAQTPTPTAPDVGSPTSAPAAGAADPPRRRPPDEIRAWSTSLFGEGP